MPDIEDGKHRRESPAVPAYMQIALHATSLWLQTVFLVSHNQLAGTAS